MLIQSQNRATFLYTVFLTASVVAFVMGFIRWQDNIFLGIVDFGFSFLSIGLIFYLKNNLNKIELVTNIAIILCFFLFMAIYVLASNNESRISLFFLLIASVIFLKGQQAGKQWLIIILVSLWLPTFWLASDTLYSSLDLATSSIHLLVFFLIFNHYEKIRKNQQKELKKLNTNLNISIEAKTKELRLANTKLEEDKKQLEITSSNDYLTGVFNRHKFSEIFDYERLQAARHDSPLSLIILDIDWFKKINDDYGHNSGDKVLTEIAVILKLSVRESDVIVRWGGEEFIVMTPKSDLEQTALLAEKLRKHIEKNKFLIARRITASFGVAILKQDDSLESLVNKADEALYKAKEAGRNNVQINDS